MASGSKELTRRATAHLVGLAFAITYLVTTWTGAGATTALMRGSIAALATMIVGQWLCRPVVDVILDAAARDEARRQAEQAKEDQA